MTMAFHFKRTNTLFSAMFLLSFLLFLPCAMADVLDTDGDGLSDYDEIHIYGTNPYLLSTDGDKYDDGQEILGISPRGNLPNYVLPPGNNPFIAAFPDISIEIHPNINIEALTTITTSKTISQGEMFGYSTATTNGVSTTIGSSESQSASEWQEANNSEAIGSARETSSNKMSSNKTETFKQTVEGKQYEFTEDLTAGLSTTTKGYVEGSVNSLGVVTGTVGVEKSVTLSAEVHVGAKQVFSNQDTNSELNSMEFSVEEGSKVGSSRTLMEGSNDGVGYETTASQYYEVTHYTETTVTNSHQIATGQEWTDATAVNTAQAAKIRFTFYLKNTGTDIAKEIKDLRFNLFIGDRVNPITYPAMTETAISLSNLLPGSRIEYSGEIILTLEELRDVDSGKPIRIVVASYSYGDDQLAFENAWGGGVLFEVNRGISGNNEMTEKYLITIMDPEETYVDLLNRAGIVGLNGFNQITSIKGLEISEKGWWTIYQSDYEDPGIAFSQEKAMPRSKVIMVYNQDSDDDGYSDRTETRMGTSLNDPSSHPFSSISAGKITTVNQYGETEIRLVLKNIGDYTASGIEAHLYAPEQGIEVIDDLIGGAGRLLPGEQLLVPDDKFIYQKTDPTAPDPVVVVYYNDPSGFHKIITEVEVNSGEEDLTALAMSMMQGPEVNIQAFSQLKHGIQNPFSLEVKNNHRQGIQGGRLMLSWFRPDGTLIEKEIIPVDLAPYSIEKIGGYYDPATSLSTDMIGSKIKLVVYYVDCQDTLIYSTVKTFEIIDGTAPPNPPILATSIEAWDVGTIARGLTLSKSIVVANEGLSPLEFSVFSSAGYLTVQNPVRHYTVQPGESRSISLKLETTGMSLGDFSTNLYIVSNDYHQFIKTIPCTGVIDSEISGVIVEDVPNRPWEKKVTIPGAHAKGTELLFDHGILSEPEKVVPIAIYDETKSRLLGSTGSENLDRVSGETLKHCWFCRKMWTMASYISLPSERGVYR